MNKVEFFGISGSGKHLLRETLKVNLKKKELKYTRIKT